MKTLTRVAFFALFLGVAPFSLSHAQEPVDLSTGMDIEEVMNAEEMMEDDADIQAMQDEMESEDPDRPPTLEEAKAALDALPGSKHATKGTVPLSKNNEVYDMYGRQLAYREGAKAYRESLDKRREAFAKPRTDRIDAYNKTREMIYAAETAEYQRKLNEEREEMKASEAHKLPTGEVYDAVVEDGLAEEIGLKEQRIPTDPSQRKKVVTAGNAPAFDPARLNMRPHAVEDVEPPPMPEVVEEVNVPVAEDVTPIPEPVAEIPKNTPAVAEDVPDVPAVAEEVETQVPEVAVEVEAPVVEVPEAEVPEADVLGDEVSEVAVPELEDALVEEINASTELFVEPDSEEVEEVDNPFSDGNGQSYND
jgi:hypothetical protein